MKRPGPVGWGDWLGRVSCGFLAFYFAVGLVIFSPCLIGGMAYFDGDLYAQYVPMRIFLKSSIAAGHFPLWCPSLLGGQPFFADPNTMAAYPLTYLTLPLPVPYGFGFFYFLHFLLAALGMHFWLRTFGLSADACRVGGLLFSISGFFGWEIIHPPLLAAYAWMPWWGATLEKLSEKLNSLWAFAAGLAFSLLFLSGSFQMTLGALYAGGAYFLFRLLSRRDWRENIVGGKLLPAALGFLWGALPLLILWLPASEFLNRSERLHANLDYETFQADYSLDPRQLGGFLYPTAPFKPTGEALPLMDYLSTAGYLGPWALFLMILAFRGAQRKLTWFMAAAGGIAILLSFGKYFPLHQLACLLVPGVGLTRAPFRFLFLYVTAGSVLAALGFETFKKSIESKESHSDFILKGAALYGVTVLFLAWGQGRVVWPQWLGLGLGLAALYFWKLNRHPMAGKLFLLSLIVSLLFTGWRASASRLGPGSNFDFASRCDALVRLKERVGLGRVLIGDKIPYPIQTMGKTISMELPTDAAYVTGLRNAMGYNPLVLDKYSDLYLLTPRTFARLTDLKAFISGDPRWRMPGFSREDWNGVGFCQNQEPVSFVYAPDQVESVPDDQQRLALMGRPDFNPYETAYFSEPLSESQKLLPGVLPAHLEYQLEKEAPDLESFQIKANRPGWVVFSEVMYPGWKAWVDGKASDILTANHVFRALWVTEGEHEVLFRYEPWWWKTLLVGLGLWILSVLALLCGPWGRGFLKEFQQI